MLNLITKVQKPRNLSLTIYNNVRRKARTPKFTDFVGSNSEIQNVKSRKPGSDPKSTPISAAFFETIPTLNQFIRDPENNTEIQLVSKKASVNSEYKLFLQQQFPEHVQVNDWSETRSSVNLDGKAGTEAGFFMRETVKWDDVFNPNFENKVNKTYKIVSSVKVDAEETESIEPENIQNSESISFKFTKKYGSPTTVQKQVWALDNKFKHLLFSAPTATGKTLAYGELIAREKQRREKTDSHNPFCLVLTPNEKMVNQISQELINIYGLKVFTQNSRLNYSEPTYKLKHYDVIVSTPAIFKRWCDHWHMSVKTIEMLCLDEADHILVKRFNRIRNAFGEEVETYGRGDFGRVFYIMKKLINCKKSVLSSATLGLEGERSIMNFQDLMKSGILDYPVNILNVEEVDSGDTEVSGVGLNTQIKHVFIDNTRKRWGEKLRKMKTEKSGETPKCQNELNEFEN